MRFNKVGAILGQRGTGKSLFILGSKFSAKNEDKNLGIKGLIEAYQKSSIKKILIIDTIDHPLYKNIPILPKDKFKIWNSGIVRIYLQPELINGLVDLINKSTHLNNTFIIFEDATKYTESKLPKVFKRLIADSKQRNIDIIFLYHSWGQTPLDLFRNMDFIQLFKTKDTPKIRENSIIDYNDVLTIFNEIKESDNNFMSRFIDTSTI
jgi:hypothetical protein